MDGLTDISISWAAFVAEKWFKHLPVFQQEYEDFYLKWNKAIVYKYLTLYINLKQMLYCRNERYQHQIACTRQYLHGK